MFCKCFHPPVIAMQKVNSTGHLDCLELPKHLCYPLKGLDAASNIIAYYVRSFGCLSGGKGSVGYFGVV